MNERTVQCRAVIVPVLIPRNIRWSQIWADKMKRENFVLCLSDEGNLPKIKKCGHLFLSYRSSGSCNDGVLAFFISIKIHIEQCYHLRHA